MQFENFGIVRNIPSPFHSSDLKNFFSDFVENAKFKCFHYKHRPEHIRSTEAKGDCSDVSERTSGIKAANLKHKSGTCCCIFEAINDETVTDVIRKYNDTNWINRSGSYMKTRCIVRRIKIGDVESETNTESHTEGFSTRGEMSYRKRHAESEEFSKADLLALSELRPLTHVMPRGNVGTTTKEFMQLIRECKLPPRIIKKLDLKFPMSGSTRRYGNVNMTYTDTSCETVPGSNTFTANGDIIEKDAVIELVAESSNFDQQARFVSKDNEKKESVGPESGPDDDDDTCEEWERHEALHNDITSQERTKERLFEEDIELKWEKGGSGLVFYTDAQFWNEQAGDFEEQNTDDWDIDMSEYYGEKGDLDARQFLEIRRERLRGKGIYDDSLQELKTRKRKKPRSRSESPPGKHIRGKFERHTKGVGRKLLEKDGWKEGDPLGPQQRQGAITDPVELDGQHPNIKRGLGYHGEKITRPTTSHQLRPSSSFLKPESRKFWGPRSGEPQATHSPLFPQFAFNLSGNKFMERTKKSRSQATPGPDDGIVITTVYDRPLDIDTRDDILRSQQPTALKHRGVPTLSDSEYVPSEKSTRDEKSYPDFSARLHLSSIKFVKGGIIDANR